ncbi:LysR substrate-binding domain-containing protein [Pseudomonas sp. ME-P-057]|uniref:LysR substrate-binding domain-containing protein n=1 Tax=Pseudomonas sp. ME-P-057 TaxID=3040321 RepID=UPI00255675C8|nr:LysR substrate-binding domain-containing protein [Pseudomonas sp. ME-P-057]
MNLRQLEAFRAVILGQTVTRAAEMLHISQPAATRLIASLEEDIGFALFDRIRGRLQPTAEALTLYQEVQRSLVGVERIARTAHDIRSLKRGSLHIACAPAMGLVFMPRVIAAFLAEHDGVQVSLVVHSSSEVIDLVVGQRCDLGIIVLPNTYPSPRAERLLATCMLCAVPANHRLAGHAVITPQDLRGEAFISYPSSIGSRQQIDTIFAAYGVERDLRVETQLSQPMCEFVELGGGGRLDRRAERDELPGQWRGVQAVRTGYRDGLQHVAAAARPGLEAASLFPGTYPVVHRRTCAECVPVLNMK